jgi:hypothetical protein
VKLDGRTRKWLPLLDIEFNKGRDPPRRRCAAPTSADENGPDLTSLGCWK